MGQPVEHLRREEAGLRSIGHGPVWAGTVPPLLALEMMRAAAALALPQPAPSARWELRQTVWGEPLVASGGRDVGIALFARANDAVDIEIGSAAAGRDGAYPQVHCQSHAVLDRLAAPARVEVARLKTTLAPADGWLAGITDLQQGDGQLLAQLRLPAPTDPEHGAYGLHPDLAQRLAPLIEHLLGAACLPSAVERLRFVSACPPNALVWLRHAPCGALDLDVCDENGDVCLQVIGLRYQRVAALATRAEAKLGPAQVSEPGSDVGDAALRAAPVLARQATAPDGPAAEPREIVLAPLSMPASMQAPEPAPGPAFGPLPHKPCGVRLLPSAQVPTRPVAGKATMQLSVLAGSAALAQDASATVRLFDLGAGVFSIELHGACCDAALEPLLQAVQHARNEASLKVLLLRGRHADAWRGDRKACNAAMERGLFRALAAFPAPVMAVVPGDATGAGLLLASVCDVMVCGEDAQLGFTDIAAGIFPSAAEQCYFVERLGEALADDLLYRSTRCSASQLRYKGWACQVAPAAQVQAQAMRLAADLSRPSQLALGLLKAHLGRHLRPLVAQLAVVEAVVAAPQAEPPACARALVFTVGTEREGCDFGELLAGLRVAFERVGALAEYSALVLAGALGALGSSLAPSDAALEGAALDELTRLVRNCPVPVIAAF